MTYLNFFFYYSKKVLIYIVCIYIGSTIGGCSITRNLGDSERLLTKIEIRNNHKHINHDDLYAIIKQKPNRKILGFIHFNLRMYNIPNREKVDAKIEQKTEQLEQQNKIRKAKGKSLKPYKPTVGEWMMDVIGEPPTIIDNILTQKSAKQMSLYLKQKGFFNNSVSDSTVFLKHKKAKIIYIVKAKTPYKIMKVGFSASDTSIANVILKSTHKTVIKPGKLFNTELFQLERKRMTEAMRNNGFYDFNKEYIRFKVDSNLNKNRVNVILIVKNPFIQKYMEGKDTLIEKKHVKYIINNIIINTNYRQLAASENFYNEKGAVLFTGNSANFKNNVIKKQIFIKPGNFYSLKNSELTKSRLSGLKTFRLINVQYEKVDLADGKHYLNCIINLTPNAKQSLTLEGKGTTRGGNLGLSGNIVYQNKNTFKGAEILEFKFKTGVQSQKTTGSSNDPTNDNRNGFFNTVEYGPELSLHIPGLLLPIKYKSQKFNRPVTTISTSFNHQNRPDYKRDIFNSSINYSLSSSSKLSHIISPLQLSLVKIDKSKSFEQLLQDSQNSLLINSYRNHLVASSKYSYIYSSQTANKFQNFIFFRSNTETAGTFVRALSGLLGLQKDANNSYKIFNIQFAQYVRQDFDFRIYNVLNKRSSLVYRGYFGIGIPFQNITVLPFEKSFFGGGANGIRGWSARTLGPGGLSQFDTTNVRIDQIGDLQIEANMEYRFDLYKSLKGAAFIDAGNIWLLKNDPKRPNGKFEFNKFYSEIAISAGLGARFDFNFFIIRLDAAIKIKDPSLVGGERWIFESKQKTNASRRDVFGENTGAYNKYSPILNIGIGYPF